jgi:hypothetical protein
MELGKNAVCRCLPFVFSPNSANMYSYSDFVAEPVKGLKKSVKELDPTYLVDGVARGTESLARHTVGGFADSASLLTETFSKNMAVLMLLRAKKR